MKRKIFIILFLTLIGFSSLTGYTIFSNTRKILYESIRSRATSIKDGFLYLVAQEKVRLSHNVEDYAKWTEMGEKGVREEDREWLRENLEPWARQHFGYELVILVKSNGKVISKGKSPEISVEELINTDGTTKSGFYLCKDGLILFSSSGVFDNDGINFYNAYLIFGKLVTEEILRSWKSVLQTDIVLSIPSRIYTTNPNLKEANIGPESYGYQSRYITVSIPVIEGDRELGRFYLYREDNALYNIYRSFIISTVLSIVSGLLIAIILARFFILRVLSHLDSFRKKAEDISRGRYESFIEIKGDEEIASLARSFNEMISRIKERESALELARLRAREISYTDELTNIPNRRYMEEYVTKLIDLGRKFSLVFLDLDGFKKVNDILGHQRGDELLHNIAKWFRTNLRETDMVVSRYGGDEFCLILVGADKKSSERIVERLYKRFHEEDFFTEEIPISFSYGIASYPDDADNMYGLLNIADREMYKMKENRKRFSA